MLPNFLIIGAAKAATSAMYEYLREHPQVFMPRRKEFHHFATRPHLSGPALDVALHDSSSRYYPVVDRDEYERYFADAGDAVAVGEASPTYMYYSASAGNIHEAIPTAKLIALLRDPADRAFSGWVHLVRDRAEPLGFAQALRDESDRIRRGMHAGFHYREFGYYARQLRPFYKLFPRDQILVLLHEDLQKAPAATMKKVYAFLGLEQSFLPHIGVQHNKSGIPKYPGLHQFLEKGIHQSIVGRVIKAPFSDDTLRRLIARTKNWNLRKPLPPVDVLADLRQQYRDDILETQELTGRNLSHWLAR